jgi:hypothetical protein
MFRSFDRLFTWFGRVDGGSLDGAFGDVDGFVTGLGGFSVPMSLFDLHSAPSESALLDIHVGEARRR